MFTSCEGSWESSCWHFPCEKLGSRRGQWFSSLRFWEQDSRTLSNTSLELHRPYERNVNMQILIHVNGIKKNNNEGWSSSACNDLNVLFGGKAKNDRASNLMSFFSVWGWSHILTGWTRSCVSFIILSHGQRDRKPSSRCWSQFSWFGSCK